MTQTTNRLFDDFAKLMNDATGMAQGVKREVETMVRTQAERFLADMDLVRRDEFEAVKEMAANARAEADALKRRVSELEEKLDLAKPGPAEPAGGESFMVADAIVDDGEDNTAA